MSHQTKHNSVHEIEKNYVVVLKGSKLDRCCDKCLNNIYIEAALLFEPTRYRIDSVVFCFEKLEIISN